MSFFFGTLKRELVIAARRRVELTNPLFFFLMVVAMFPLGMGPDPERLTVLAPGIIWIVALLSTLLAADGLFRTDADDGCLEQLLLSPQSLYVGVLAKLGAHWLVTGLPLSLCAPLLGLMLQLPTTAMTALFASLFLGSIVLSFLAGIGAGLTVGLARGGVLVSLLILPLYVPVLIFGAGSVQAAAQGIPATTHLAILAAMLCLAVSLSPLAIAAGLRISMDN